MDEGIVAFLRFQALERLGAYMYFLPASQHIVQHNTFALIQSRPLHESSAAVSACRGA